MQIRYAVPGDGPACNAFYNGHYGLERTDEQWRWEFVLPTRDGELPYALMIDEGEVVGSQAFIPIRFIDEAGSFMTAKSEETLVSARMRGKSVFGRMYDRLFQYAVDHDFKSIWGFTPAEAAFSKLGFQIPGRTGQLFLAIKPRALSEAVSAQGQAVAGIPKIGLNAAGAVLSIWSRLCGLGAAPRLRSDEHMMNLEDASLFDEAYCRRFIDAWGGTTILRDREYMQWRIFENPYRRANVVAVVTDGQLMGHVAFAIGDDGTGYLVDVMAAKKQGSAESARMVRALVGEAIRRLKRMGATCVRSWTVNDHPFDQVVRKAAVRLGFVVLKRGNAVVFHTAFQPALRNTSHDDFGNWYVTRLFTEGASG